MNLKKVFIPLLLLPLLFLNSCASTCGMDARANGKKAKFKQVFCWGRPATEEEAEKYSEIGVTHIPVGNVKQMRLALKYNMIPYCASFFPRGPHKQVMEPEDEKLFAYLSGEDLGMLSKQERAAILDARRIEKRHRYGGEPEAERDVLNTRIDCFLSDKDLVLSKKLIDSIFAKVPEARGIYFDYLGYMNFKDCRCASCNGKFAAAKKNSPALSRDEFFRDALVKYYNDMIDYVKEKYHGAKVVVHIYPTFLAEPLYGNRTKADYCAQTVAWYFPWKKEKIAGYTEIVTGDAEKYHKGVKGIPFVGLKALPGTSLAGKSPELLEEELKTILAAGGDTLSVCNGRDMIKPGYYEVFKKYCGK